MSFEMFFLQYICYPPSSFFLWRLAKSSSHLSSFDSFMMDIYLLSRFSLRKVDIHSVWYFQPPIALMMTTGISVLWFSHGELPLIRNFVARDISLGHLRHSKSTILMHPKPLAPTEFHPLSLRCVLQSFLLLLLSYTINAWPNLIFLVLSPSSYY